MKTKNQSQESRLETPNKKQNSDTLRGDDEISKEVLRNADKGAIYPKEWKIQGILLRVALDAIALTREACEKRFEIGWHKESFEKGQKAERQRILEIINECHTRYGTHQRGNDMKNCIDPDELKREVLKDGM